MIRFVHATFVAQAQQKFLLTPNRQPFSHIIYPFCFFMNTYKISHLRDKKNYALNDLSNHFSLFKCNIRFLTCMHSRIEIP